MLSIDVETSTLHKGNPFSADGQLVCIGWYDLTGSGVVYLDQHDELIKLKRKVKDAKLLCGANIKFDLHWLRRYGFEITGSVWDISVAEYYKVHQTERYISLNILAERYLNDRKLDVIKTEYWDRGIDTPDIPRGILSEYCLKDVVLTYKIATIQRQTMQDKLALVRLHMADLLVLEEMEYNGMEFDRAGALRRCAQLEARKQRIFKYLNNYDLPPNFNWNSPEHLSALLFGGIIEHVIKVPDGVFKSGQRKGLEKFKNSVVHYPMKRKFKPLQKTAKEGVYSTDDATLAALDGKLPRAIKLIRKIEKLLGTYFYKQIKMLDDMQWSKIHGTFKQGVTTTGRLSSEKPNLQNTPPDVGRFYVAKS